MDGDSYKPDLNMTFHKESCSLPSHQDQLNVATFGCSLLLCFHCHGQPLLSMEHLNDRDNYNKDLQSMKALTKAYR